MPNDRKPLGLRLVMMYLALLGVWWLFDGLSLLSYLGLRQIEFPTLARWIGATFLGLFGLSFIGVAAMLMFKNLGRWLAICLSALAVPLSLSIFLPLLPSSNVSIINLLESVGVIVCGILVITYLSNDDIKQLFDKYNPDFIG